SNPQNRSRWHSDKLASKSNEQRRLTMTQTTFPEIQAAADALESRITITETEIAEMKESIKAKKALVRSWRKPFPPLLRARQRRRGVLLPSSSLHLALDLDAKPEFLIALNLVLIWC